MEGLKSRGRDVLHLDDRKLREELRTRLRDVRALLGRDIPRTRQITLVVTPGGYSEGWNTSLTFSIEGFALAA